jgi:tripartite-type tricarboxylate transporter receptor subunit TctC
MLNRRTAMTAAALASLPSAWAQSDFPNRPLRLIVPLQAGGIADVAARAVMLELEKKLGQPIIVDNKPGGQFLIAIQALQAAPADGYTMLALNGGFCAIQTVTKLYDVQKAFTPVSINTEAAFSLIVSGKSPFKTFAEFLDFAKKNPNKLNYAIPGLGTMEHMKNVQLANSAGFTATAVPYKNGGPDMVKGVIGGEVDYTICPSFLAKMFSANGAVRNLLIVHDTPNKDFPDTPTLPQAGVKVDPLRVWGGYAVHNDTPPALVQRLYQAITETMKTPALIEKHVGMGASVLPSKNPEEARKFIASELAWMNAVLPSLNLKQG